MVAYRVLWAVGVGSVRNRMHWDLAFVATPDYGVCNVCMYVTSPSPTSSKSCHLYQSLYYIIDQ